MTKKPLFSCAAIRNTNLGMSRKGGNPVQPNATVTALVVLLYLASSLSGMRANKTGSQVTAPPGVQTTEPTPQKPGNVLEDTANRSAATLKNSNVRSGPGTKYPKIAKLPRNTSVRVVSEADGWYQVRLSTGAYGWISGSLLSVSPGGSVASGTSAGSSVGSDRNSGSSTTPGVRVDPSPTDGRQVVGYYTVNYPGDKSSYRAVEAHSRSLTAIAPFSYVIDKNGNVSGDHASDARELAAERGLDNLALVHNLSGGQFNRADVSSMLNSRSARTRTVDGIFEILEKRGYDGVNIDFENVPPSDRAVLTQFMRELRERLAAKGYKVTMSVPAKTSDSPRSPWAGAFDYYELGKLCDQFMIMTYDEHTPGTEPGPIASVQWVDKVIKYAVTQIPKHKILMGVAAYGYDWDTKTNKARAVTYSSAIALANKYGKRIQWDDASQTPHFSYKSGHTTREVWFESVDSLRAKLKIVNKYDIGGIAIWRLGQEDQAYWDLITEELRKG